MVFQDFLGRLYSADGNLLHTRSAKGMDVMSCIQFFDIFGYFFFHSEFH